MIWTTGGSSSWGLTGTLFHSFHRNLSTNTNTLPYFVISVLIHMHPVLITSPFSFLFRHISKQPIERCNHTPDPGSNELFPELCTIKMLGTQNIRSLKYWRLAWAKKAYEVSPTGNHHHRKLKCSLWVSNLTQHLQLPHTIMKKQFHFRNQSLDTKRLSYYKPFSWTHPSQIQPTQHCPLCRSKKLSTATINTLQDPTSI